MKPGFISAMRQLIVPSGVLLLAIAALLSWKLQAMFAPPAGDFIAVALCLIVIPLALRLRAPRLMLMGVLLLLAERIWVWSWHAHAGSVIAGVAVLLPVNVALLLLVDEISFDWEAIGWWSALIGVQALVLAVLHGEPALLRYITRPFLPWISASGRVPHLALLLFFLTGCGLFAAFWISCKPRESGMLWALCASCFALGASSSRMATAYFATAALIVGISVIETAYLVGYHDELTGLPARRAFNQAIATLDGEYAIGIVDIDHFKQFNDTFGHDVGDQVLRMVASKMSETSGGGKVFRYGGEEFAIVFRRMSAEEALGQAEALRQTIADSTFVVRGVDRSRRRRQERRYGHSKRRVRKQRFNTQVTVSIGVAEPISADTLVEDVIQAADKALYRAKERGRNRVELYVGPRTSAAAYQSV